MSYRYPSPEAKARHLEKSRELWAKHKERKELLLASGMEYRDVLDDSELDEACRRARAHDDTCPECGGTEARMENYSMMWHEADIVCEKCDTYIRMWDAG